jgi:hypothetical protein
MRKTVVFATLTFLAIPSLCSVAQEVRYDLNGQWLAEYRLPDPTGSSELGITRIERILIRHVGNEVAGIKLTSDEADPVPVGEETIHGTYDKNPFTAKMLCADKGFVNPRWRNMTVAVIDDTHLSITRGESGCWWPSAAAWELVVRHPR